MEVLIPKKRKVLIKYLEVITQRILTRSFLHLKRVYKIEFDAKTDDLFEELSTKLPTKFQKISKRPKTENVVVYDPTDYMWYLTTQDTTGWLWHLHKIRANLAWDITHGNGEVKIASIDTWFDINHPDLSQKINPHFDPYSNTNYSTSCTRNNHGTTVASFIAAETDGGGQLASAGFDCRIIAYQAWAGNYLERAHHASFTMNADIITSSAGGWYCDTNDGIDSIEMVAVQDILDNGTIIVMPAGNGNSGYSCGSAPNYRPIYPLTPLYDERIIVVTSTDVNDNHSYGSTVHSYFSEVDICAPGYCVMGATCTEKLVDGNCEENTWPYYGCSTGTSFAAPIVAGVCGLMKTVNPCITPAEAQDIIKSTADPVNDAHLYPGMVGAGRINAYKAVKKAATRHVQDNTFSGTQTITAHIIEAGNHVTDTEPTGDVIIQSGGNVAFEGRYEVTLDSGFEVESNARFTIEIDPYSNISCN